MDIIFFLLFAVSIVGIYLGVRRELAPVGMVAGFGIMACSITMILFLLQRVDVALQGVIFGLIIGAVMAIATLAVAWYFHTQEREQA
ncbi:MAG: hypothetical protein EA396_03265 [Anaerolineaceae bacterium]|nr:MAG: hypothetical protein EA396_03265 [Anaerolineaceae bacterium]